MEELDLTIFYVGDPEELGETEKERWKKIEPVILELLEELKKGGKLKSVTLPGGKFLPAVMRKLEAFRRVHYFFNNVFEDPNYKEILELNSKYGLDESTVITAYAMASFSVAMLSTELFKLLLLFFTKGLNPSVARFNETIKKAAPNTWSKLEPFVDNKLRNAVAHGTYAIVDNRIQLFRNAILELDEEMSLTDFITRLIDQSILYQVLVSVMAEKLRQKYRLVACHR